MINFIRDLHFIWCVPELAEPGCVMNNSRKEKPLYYDRIWVGSLGARVISKVRSLASRSEPSLQAHPRNASVASSQGPVAPWSYRPRRGAARRSVRVGIGLDELPDC